MQCVNDGITEAMRYVKAGDGNSVTLTREGKKLFRDFIKNKGGVQKATDVLPVGRNTVSSLKNGGRCQPGTWVKIFSIITETAA